MSGIPFYSKHNQVYPALRQGRAAVEKHFGSPDDWQKERELYAALGGRVPIPEVLGAEPDLLSYDPADTATKRLAAGVLARELSVPNDLVREARCTLSVHRQGRDTTRSMSGIVLAGGASQRMGQNKAELVLNGKTLLQHQVDKLRTLGIEDIMLSGAGCPALPGTRVIPDEFPGKGPLAGLHACLNAARNPACLVLSVDVPLVPVSALAHLCRAHRGGVTVLCRGEREEPLIAVYDRAAAAAIPAMLERGEYAVRGLKDTVPWNRFHYLGPEELLLNCNRPEDFLAAKMLKSL